jgi:hypothetical protein
MEEFMYEVVARMKRGEERIFIGFYCSAHLNILEKYCGGSFILMGQPYFIAGENVYRFADNALVLVGSLGEVVEEMRDALRRLEESNC